MVARAPGDAPRRADALRGSRGGARDRARELPDAVAAPCLPSGAGDEPSRAIPRRARRRRGRRLRRDVADGRRGPHHDLRGGARMAAAGDRGVAAPRAPGPRAVAGRARGDAGGAALEPGRAPALREVRLPPGGSPAALLQRRQRGRPDHDHRAARIAGDGAACRAPAGRAADPNRRSDRGAVRGGADP